MTDIGEMDREALLLLRQRVIDENTEIRRIEAENKRKLPQIEERLGHLRIDRGRRQETLATLFMNVAQEELSTEVFERIREKAYERLKET